MTNGTFDDRVHKLSLWTVLGPLSIEQVYGIEWDGGQKTYDVYKDFQNTPLQRTEMLKFDIKGLKQCHIGDWNKGPQHVYAASKLLACRCGLSYSIIRGWRLKL